MAPNRDSATAPTAFVIFGITGDLSARKLLPALYDLYTKGDIHHDTVIMGFARSEMSVDDLRTRLRLAVADEVAGFDDATFDELTGRLEYVKGSYDEPAAYDQLAALLADSAETN